MLLWDLTIFFTIRDPKVRRICAAPFGDRVLHHAVMRICEPFFERYLIADSYACRNNKGNCKALAKAQSFSKKNQWYLKLDIHKYFDSIDHEIALWLLARRFKDKELLKLFSNILDSYYVQPGKGIPIGNLFSQHLANMYLGYFDHWIKEELHIKSYIRYMDDFIVFSGSKEALREYLKKITLFLAGRLSLQLKDNVQLNQTRFGCPFLGFRVFPTRLRLNRRSKYRYSKKFRYYENLYRKGIWSEQTLARHVEALNAFSALADSGAFRQHCITRFGCVS